MEATTTLNMPIDRDVKMQCEELFSALGMSLPTAINIFLRQALRTGSIPFPLKADMPNEETVAALIEAEELAHDPSAKRYSNVEDLIEDLNR